MEILLIAKRVFDLGPSSLSQGAKLHSASLYGIDLSHSEPIRVFYYSNYRGQERYTNTLITIQSIGVQHNDIQVGGDVVPPCFFMAV